MAYCQPLIPISIKKLVSDQSIKSPIMQRQASRPKIKRIRTGLGNANKHVVATALIGAIIGRRCRGQPASSRRRKRAHDWLEEIQSRGEDSEEDDDVEDSENETILEEGDER